MLSIDSTYPMLYIFFFYSSRFNHNFENLTSYCIYEFFTPLPHDKIFIFSKKNYIICIFIPNHIKVWYPILKFLTFIVSYGDILIRQNYHFTYKIGQICQIYIVHSTYQNFIFSKKNHIICIFIPIHIKVWYPILKFFTFFAIDSPYCRFQISTVDPKSEV